MGDFGLRISKDGSDVKTCLDKDCVITSKYSTLKGAILVTGSVAVADGALQTVEITHGLGYMPFVKAFVKIPASEDFLNNYYPLPLWVDGVEDHIYSSASADTSKVYLEIEQWNFSEVSKTYYYSVYIFLDKAKL